MNPSNYEEQHWHFTPRNWYSIKKRGGTYWCVQRIMSNNPMHDHVRRALEWVKSNLKEGVGFTMETKKADYSNAYYQVIYVSCKTKEQAVEFKLSFCDWS